MDFAVMRDKRLSVKGREAEEEETQKYSNLLIQLPLALLFIDRIRMILRANSLRCVHPR